MLKKIIAGKIRANGPMPFKTFMKEALYHPDYGYYMSSNPFGREGDFFTASHLHPAFGAAIGRQIEQMWTLMGSPTLFHIIEFGPGRALLASDMLRYLSDTVFFKSISYVIIEANPRLRRQQEAMLAPFSGTVSWTASISALPPVAGCILSNELLDAFAVHLVQMDNGALKEVWVAAQEDTLYEILAKPSKEIIEYVEEFNIDVLRDSNTSFNSAIAAEAAIQSTYRTEINLAIRDWLKDCSTILREGFIITIDYGFPAWQYYQPGRCRGTLLCYHRHKTSENPYVNIGQQDITAHVNFSALGKWGTLHGFTSVGYAAQGTFLLSLGIDELICQIPKDEDYQFEAIKIKRLLVPEGMGQSHKVMIQYKGMEKETPVLKGFTIRNQLRELDVSAVYNEFG
ncbi:MAG: SAM-dependent methyltransferase [Nitrospirae bacterium]|nr:SAM-dependent methyltransferase [Nitrospirota bacterium]